MDDDGCLVVEHPLLILHRVLSLAAETLDEFTPLGGACGTPAKLCPWEATLGPLTFGSGGVCLRPQLKLGLQRAGFRVDLGVGDVREGLSLQYRASTAVEASSTGKSVRELHDTIKVDTPAAIRALDTVRELLSGWCAPVTTARGPLLQQAAERLGMSAESFVAVLMGDAASRGHRSTDMALRVTTAVSVGADLRLCLGWPNAEGYRMVGVGGGVNAMLTEIGTYVFVGHHWSGSSMKLIVGLAQSRFEYTVNFAGGDPAKGDLAGPAKDLAGPAEDDPVGPAKEDLVDPAKEDPADDPASPHGTNPNEAK